LPDPFIIMKPKAILCLLLPLLASSIFAGELKLDWKDPESFRDADYYYNGGKKSKEIVMNSLDRFFTKEAKNRLPEASTLEMTIIELDLAGDFEPWNMPHNQDVRVIKRLYPALIEFEYRYLDANGGVISEGTEKLVDRNVPSSLRARTLGNHENYPFVKSLIRDWIRDLAKS
jgi:hypothetical protein